MRGQIETLLAARAERVWPGLDDKVLTSWNGLMIGALARASVVLERPDYLAAAEKAADFILTDMTRDGKLLHSYCRGEAKIDAFLDDHIFLCHALLDLHEASGEEKWMKGAKDLVTALNKSFRDQEGGGYYFTSEMQETLLTRGKDPFDSAVPSGNGMAALTFVRMGRLLGSEPYLQRGKEIAQIFDVLLARAPRAAATMLLALSMHIDETDGAAAPVAVEAEAKADATAQGPNVRFDLTVNRKQVKAGDTIAVIAKFIIADKWHIQSNEPEEEFVIPTSVALADKSLCETVATVYPATHAFKLGDEEAQGFSGEGQVVLTAKVLAAAKPGKQELVVKVGWQACDDQSCIAPEEFDLKIPLEVVE